jgi:pimeloyl-ACP methyl ester carboxylesterase
LKKDAGMKAIRSTLAAMTALVVAAISNAQPAPPAVSIVLVHGALIDGSSWRGVYEVLAKDGYRVCIVQPPLSGLDEDVAATRRVLAAKTACSTRRLRTEWRAARARR